MSKITRNLIIKSSYEANKDSLENTNSIILPKGILEEILSSKQENYFFKITNPELGIYTYVGVMEFSEDEDVVIVPFWLYEYLAATSSTVVEIELINNIIKGKKITLEPLDECFFKIPEYEAVLEVVLSRFGVLHYNSSIKVDIMDKKYLLKIKDIEHDYSELFQNTEEVDEEKLNNINMEAINIINTDLNVEIFNSFLEKELKKKQEEEKRKEEERKRQEEKRRLEKEQEEKRRLEEQQKSEKGFVPFSGKGNRLGGD
ncbi:Ubiquitin fusion degradation protein UFD1 [seawater metagenome]|uniref:Ubiquitin fusion degradation protein UFD1 n=1 Tax=seawater metagenome TaxID=1561972 RepID=A0A5E8CKM5_9ZZZZ